MTIWGKKGDEGRGEKNNWDRWKDDRSFKSTQMRKSRGRMGEQKQV